MRRAVMSTTLAGLVVALAATVTPSSPPKAGSSDEPSTRPSDDELIVHEWGTFTSFAGSDGIQLDFRPLLEEDLPPFVLDRAMQTGGTLPWLVKARTRALQRMETPVTYFYTDKPREVEVRVAFPRGLLTDFYPPVKYMRPAFDPSQPTAMKNSMLCWGKVRLIPDRSDASAPLRSKLPKVDGSNHYIHARETDSAIVHLRQTVGEKATDHYEKFLFYRGIGNCRLPLSMKALGDGEFELQNSGEDAIRSLFLVSAGQGTIRFTQHNVVGPGETVRLTLSQTAAATEDLSAAVVGELVRAGLYEKEAKAMVATWRDSWFEENGTRLFYILPRKMVDAMLPLHIAPQPDKVVRVMVGRYEIMTPEVERTLQAQLEVMTALPPLFRAAAAEKILDAGRFAEPALVRIQHVAENASVRQQAAALLLKLRSQPQ